WQAAYFAPARFLVPLAFRADDIDPGVEVPRNDLACHRVVHGRADVHELEIPCLLYRLLCLLQQILTRGERCGALIPNCPAHRILAREAEKPFDPATSTDLVAPGDAP